MTGKHDAIAATDIAFIKLSMSEMAILHKLMSWFSVKWRSGVLR
jgi:hypothetical protein